LKFLEDSLLLICCSPGYFYSFIDNFHHKPCIVLSFVDYLIFLNFNVFVYFNITCKDEIMLLTLCSIHINYNIPHAYSCSCCRSLWVMTGQLRNNLKKYLVNRVSQFLHQIIKLFLIALKIFRVSNFEEFQMRLVIPVLFYLSFYQQQIRLPMWPMLWPKRV
jgi:hypothetical protein